ncbi:hypothetical protein AAP_01173 [Ascosphaera apis ARSEF 7405]|uniref:Uncharacterized protein n=1 Tax=Ascosphaera apis ARSEF 7405 TaxID=392613 RepID=A0A166PFC2_9EURO|nr:hypothetical protein AAP_01173 [Ascosphaera apis ARSEF 7405]
MNPRLVSTRLASLASSSSVLTNSAIRQAHIVSATRAYSQALQYPALTTRSLHLPRILDPELYRAILPKGWGARTHDDPDTEYIRPTRNPAFFYTIIFMFIGSQAIHLLVLRKERESFERSSDARIRVLKDVIGRLQRGEDIDVKKVLGTGDEKQEKSWEDLIREIEEEDEREREGDS